MLKQAKYKEKKFNTTTHIGGWYIPLDVCNELIKFFELNVDLQCEAAHNENGKVGINKNIKEGTDLEIDHSYKENIIGKYREHLQEILTLYLKKYEYSNRVHKFDINRNYNIQKYPIGGGYKVWHHENTGESHYALRHLVFMTYLNNVKNGGTEFLYQQMSVEAKKGLTLIWPATWTHTHRGIVSNDKEKYIVTGWYSFEK